MRVVAVQATTLDRAVLEFDFRDGIAKGFMAANAEVVPGLQQVAFVVGGVWIMAPHTIPLNGYLVSTDRLLGNDVVVALQADRTRRRVQELAVGGGMRIMASGTFGRLHRSVNELALELLLEVVMAVETKLSFGPRLQSELVLTLPKGARDHQNGQDHES